MRRVVVLVVLAPLVAVAEGKPARWSELDDAGRAALFAGSRAVEVADTLARLTEPFVGTPYGLSPLGEGEGVDADPRLRWDVVDCLTFVETAMALAAAPAPDRVVEVLDDVRYAAAPATFLNRNHFMEAQWIPNNLLKGWLRDVSREVGGDRVVMAEKVYAPERWTKRKQLGDMPLALDEIPRGTFRLPMVPFAVARERQARIRAGTLLFVIRKDFYSQPTRVTHVGIVLVKDGRRILRHASKAPYHRVVDEPLESFFARNANYAKWPVEGFALYEIRVPAARVAGLFEQEPSAGVE